MANNSILLVGAGFSRNWGAPVASEVANSLLREVGEDPYLQNLLAQHEKNFENALSQIQKEYISSPSSLEVKNRFDKLQTAIIAMFDRLNTALERKPDFEFSQERSLTVTEFLVRFDAIFGLNQDLLLELRYEHHVRLANARRWDGLQLPGIKPIHNAAITGIGDKHKRRWTPLSPPFAVGARLQPYFKLHGSSNWYTGNNQNLLVMGGDKEFIISQSDLLRWYYDQFKKYLSQPDTRLMVIGYSFSDSHINAAIIEAWKNGSLKGIFLVNPSGRDVLNSKGLEGIHSIGGSTRLMSETFAGDQFEHQNFMRFFS